MVAKINTDTELWRQTPGDYCSPSIHVTESGEIGINLGGSVVVAPVEEWHHSLRRLNKAWAFMAREGYRYCDIPACNCGSWHKAQPMPCGEDNHTYHVGGRHCTKCGVLREGTR